MRQSDSPEYQAWKGIKRRCLNSKCPGYRYYGGRGITVCSRWRLSFAAFFADVGPRPSTKHSIDRIDNNGHYEPGNVRWATQSEQNRNRRDNVIIEFNGRRQTLMAWSKELGLGFGVLRNRIKKWGIERAMTVPPPTSQFGNTRGEQTGHATLTESKVIAIRKAFATGQRSMRSLADEYGVVEGCIRKIVKRQSWKHLSEKPSTQKKPCPS